MWGRLRLQGSPASDLWRRRTLVRWGSVLSPGAAAQSVTVCPFRVVDEINQVLPVHFSRGIPPACKACQLWPAPTELFRRRLH